MFIQPLENGIEALVKPLACQQELPRPKWQNKLRIVTLASVRVLCIIFGIAKRPLENQATSRLKALRRSFRVKEVDVRVINLPFLE